MPAIVWLSPSSKQVTEETQGYKENPMSTTNGLDQDMQNAISGNGKKWIIGLVIALGVAVIVLAALVITRNNDRIELLEKLVVGKSGDNISCPATNTAPAAAIFGPVQSSDASPAPANILNVKPLVEPAAPAPAPKPVVAPKATSTASSSGVYAVRLHTLYSAKQIGLEEKETAVAFEKCGTKTPITFCVAKLNGQRIAMASLAKSESGMTITEAKAFTICFNQRMLRAKNSETDEFIPNAAEPIEVGEFADACEASE
jgi:hypothetical protein